MQSLFYLVKQLKKLAVSKIARYTIHRICFEPDGGKDNHMKTAILYQSQHHGNTKKLLDAMAEMGDITLIKAEKAVGVDLSGYDAIGFASGIYFWDFGELVKDCAKKCLPQDKKVFLIYTCGTKLPVYTKTMRAIFQEKGCTLLGTFACRGYDTFGVFGKLGGIAKGKPNANDLVRVREFYRKTIAPLV